jgi:S1-C subfamily serine protease
MGGLELIANGAIGGAASRGQGASHEGDGELLDACSEAVMQLNQLAGAGAVLVTEVTAGSPAAHAGVCGRDTIIGFADAVVGGIDHLQLLRNR